ncbi:MAG: MSMEG_4193 family putative phosphomutase [Actinomycetota bacterium]
MTMLLLIRHALTSSTGKRLSGSTPGIHLSDDGRSQAAGLAERLAPLRLAALYASPLERSVETAEVIAAATRLPVRPLPEVIEVGYGTWTGRSLAQLSRTSLWKRVQQSPSAIRFPGGETLIEVQRRSVAALDSLAARHPRGTVAVVSHADVIRLAIAHYAGVHIDLFQRLIVSPASVTAIGLGDRVPRIVRVNDTGTLADLDRRAAPRRSGSR